ncbi:MAG: hypothetical protein AAGI30_07130 [Planctomycetota bacterium]
MNRTITTLLAFAPAMCLALSPLVWAEFIAPEGLGSNVGWQRGSDADSLLTERDQSVTPSGPDSSDVTSDFGAVLSLSAPVFNVRGESGTSFIESGGNNDSLSVLPSVVTEVPDLGLGGGNTAMLVLQTRSLNNAIGAPGLVVPRDGFLNDGARELTEFDRQLFRVFNADRIDALFTCEFAGRGDMSGAIASDAFGLAECLTIILPGYGD